MPDGYMRPDPATDMAKIRLYIIHIIYRFVNINSDKY